MIPEFFLPLQGKKEPKSPRTLSRSTNRKGEQGDHVRISLLGAPKADRHGAKPIFLRAGQGKSRH